MLGDFSVLQMEGLTELLLDQNQNKHYNENEADDVKRG